jgi:thiamine-phosphate pyrophosphorylase
MKPSIATFGPIYAVTPSAPLGGDEVVARVYAALAGGIRLVQWRRKGEGIDPRDGIVEAREACRDAGALFIVNDDVDLALEAGADGVHVGGDDADPDTARGLLGPDAYIGVSCYASMARAQAAVASGADYVAFGSLFPSPTKPGAPRCPLERLAAAKAQFGVPVCGIGGIGTAEVPAVLKSGADLVAVISALFDAGGDVSTCARELITAAA